VGFTINGIPKGNIIMEVLRIIGQIACLTFSVNATYQFLRSLDLRQWRCVAWLFGIGVGSALSNVVAPKDLGELTSAANIVLMIMGVILVMSCIGACIENNTLVGRIVAILFAVLNALGVIALVWLRWYF
jgi:hypothetical protein